MKDKEEKSIEDVIKDLDMEEMEKTSVLGQALTRGLDEAGQWHRGIIELNVTERDTEDEKDEK